jgi:hypothetical protein
MEGRRTSLIEGVIMKQANGDKLLLSFIALFLPLPLRTPLNPTFDVW